MQLQLDGALHRLGAAFAAGGVTLYAVGGWVRDRLLGRPVYDLDVAGDASPQRVEAICRSTPGLTCTGRDAGLAALTLSLCHEGRRVEAEFTAFRRESYRRDGSHRPLTVEGGASLQEDALRRDFTVNALYVRLTDGEVLDPLGGMAQLEAGVLRTTRESGDVFAEDGLRLLRLARFACELGFSVEADTLAGARERIGGLAHIVPARIGQELRRILMAHERNPREGAAAAARGAALLGELGAYPVLLPGQLPPGEEQLSLIARTEPSLSQRMAALLSCLSPEEAGRFCRHIQLGSELAGRVKQLLTEPEAGALTGQLALMGREGAREYAAFQRARGREEADREYRAMVAEGMPFGPGELALRGDEIARILGQRPGPETGRMKAALYQMVIGRTAVNEAAALGDRLKELLAQPAGREGPEIKEEKKE